MPGGGVSLFKREISAPKEGNPNPVLRDKTSDMFHVKVQMQNLFGDNWASLQTLIPISHFFMGAISQIALLPF